MFGSVQIEPSGGPSKKNVWRDKKATRKARGRAMDSDQLGVCHVSAWSGGASPVARAGTGWGGDL